MNLSRFSPQLVSALFFLVCGATAQAQTTSPPGFRFKRTVAVSQPGPQRLSVDLELLAHAKSTLADYRLFDGGSAEVAYLIVPPVQGEPEWQEAKGLALLVGDKDSSGFEADLGKLLEIDQITLRGLPPPVLKRLRVEASGDHRRYTLVAQDETVFDLPEDGLSRMSVTIPKGAYRYLRVIWEDRETPKLPLPERVIVRLSRDGQSPQPTKAAVPFEPSSSRADTTQYRIQLPAKHLPIDAIVLETSQPQLMRRARISEARTTGNGLDSFVLGTTTLRRALRSGLVAADLRIAVERPETSAIILTIENGNSPPISVSQVYVELAPQPFIYFEARHAGTFTAHFGAEKLSAPHYDLEAERDSAPRVNAADARWTGPAIAQAGTPSPSKLTHRDDSWTHGSTLSPRQFRFSRSIVASVESMSRLPLDAAVFAHSPTLADVRILDPQNRQVPYVLEREMEPFVIALNPQAVPTPAKPSQFGVSTSVYRITLPYPNLPEGQLIVNTRSHVFQRHVALHAPRPQRPGKPAETGEIASANWVDVSESADTPSLELAVPAGTDPNLLLVIEEGDNAPLASLSCQLHFPGRALRFFHTAGENLTLYYGAESLASPSYDLSLLTQEIEQLPSVDVGFGP